MGGWFWDGLIFSLLTTLPVELLYVPWAFNLRLVLVLGINLVLLLSTRGSFMTSLLHFPGNKHSTAKSKKAGTKQEGRKMAGGTCLPPILYTHLVLLLCSTHAFLHHLPFFCLQPG